MKATDIAAFLNKTLFGENVEIERTATLNKISSYSIIFIKKYSEVIRNTINNTQRPFLAIVLPEYHNKISCSYIISSNPRLDFIKIVTAFLTEKPKAVISSNAYVSPKAIIGKDVVINDGCYIDGDVILGDGCILYPNVTIHGKTSIGNNCTIKSGAVIGQYGFGFERDEKGTPIAFPHTGSVRIGNNVSIGANSCIDKATIDETIIEDNVKIDNLVHIAHNCRVGQSSMIASSVILCGGVKVGDRCWISPHSTILQHLTIGANSTIGMGAVVIRNVKESTTVFGNPATDIEMM